MAFGQWIDKNNDTVFFDPNDQFEGPSVALIKSDSFLAWLEKMTCS